mmetsp:Transcript_2772/g.7766  ORF Transcript_2772/g.7766 Transcript_2772/m.7766 type:complete len:374 (-) Transcript_2772:58-1179(-)
MKGNAGGQGRSWLWFGICSVVMLAWCLMLYSYSSLGSERDPRDVVAGIAWSAGAAGGGEPMSEREAARVTWLLGGKTALAKLVPQSIVRVDSFALEGGRKFLWAWYASACNGLRGGSPWSSTNGRGFGPVADAEVARIKRFGILAHGGVAIDIGPHVGDSTLPMALFANRTIAFEPNPEVYQILRANAKLNPDLNIDAHNTGIAGEDGTIEFQYGDLCNGGVAGYGTGGKKHTFRVVNLEQFLIRTYGAEIIPSIAYIKTDAEGFDHQLVTDMVSLITTICRAGRCPMLQVEWADWFQDKADPQGVTEGSRKLFDAIARLPGEWQMFCTDQCNGQAKSCSGKNQQLGEPIELTGLQPTSANHCADIILKARQG